VKHSIAWHAPAPLWDLALADAGPAPLRFHQPVILRFDGDDFQERLQATLEGDPAALGERVLRAESWREPGAGWIVEGELDGAIPTAYQPVHGRFYLVAVSLVCKRPGLPDRVVDNAQDETAGFVVRRVVSAAADGSALDPADPSSWRELAWIGDREKGVWVEAGDDRARLLEGEEQLGLAPVQFEQEALTRRLRVGLLPVAGREVYESGAQAPAPSPGELAGDPLADARVADFEQRVIGALEDLAGLPAGFDAGAARDALLFLLLDLAELLQRDQPTVWGSLDGAGGALGVAQQLLHSMLTDPVVQLGNRSWSELLLDTEPARADLLHGLVAPDLVALSLGTSSIASACSALLSAGIATIYPAALPATSATSATSEDAADDAADAVAARPFTYVVRAVYRRPRCGRAVDPLVSEPSRPFRLASFFDPDAPARPLSIRLPLDTSTEGLKRFPKAASFLISDQLRKQLQRLEGITVSSLEDGELNEEGPAIGLGVIWVLSIPIITLCAFILLMIVVSLLNIVFWWLPFFKIAIPVRLDVSS